MEKNNEKQIFKELFCNDEEFQFESFSLFFSSEADEIIICETEKKEEPVLPDFNHDQSDDDFFEWSNDSLDKSLIDLLAEDEASTNNTECSLFSSEWNKFSYRQKDFSFSGTSGLNKQIPENSTPFDIFSLFVDDEILNLLVVETNRYAEQRINGGIYSSNSRIQNWKPTNSEEIKKFLGLILYMGIVKINPIANYWSTSVLYNLKLPRTIMSRNRFELLLSNFHFADNTRISRGDRLGKISPLFDKLVKKYQEVYTPGEDIVIDETLVPWRGRLIFKQYIPNKAHKYGIKLFKLCSNEGYTWGMKIYSGKAADGIRETGLAHNVCLVLAEKLLGEGRTLFIDNFYTSYELAISCLNRETHVVGTLRKNKKNLPQDVLQCKLKRGDMVSKEDDNGIVVLKWKDVRDVRVLSTKHAPIMVPIIKKNQRLSNSSLDTTPISHKPLAVVEYNKGKCGIDHSDQMASYSSTIRKGIKWYRKLGIQLLLGISVVNALTIYEIVTNKKMNIRKFREMLIGKLFELSDNGNRSSSSFCVSRHSISVRRDESGKTIRRACKQCYADRSLAVGRSLTRKNTKKTTTYCPNCPDQPQLCLECFKVLHDN
jgi:hypothetical protein